MQSYVFPFTQTVKLHHCVSNLWKITLELSFRISEGNWQFQVTVMRKMTWFHITFLREENDNFTFLKKLALFKSHFDETIDIISIYISQISDNISTYYYENYIISIHNSEEITATISMKGHFQFSPLAGDRPASEFTALLRKQPHRALGPSQILINCPKATTLQYDDPCSSSIFV